MEGSDMLLCAAGTQSAPFLCRYPDTRTFCFSGQFANIVVTLSTQPLQRAWKQTLLSPHIFLSEIHWALPNVRLAQDVLCYRLIAPKAHSWSCTCSKRKVGMTIEYRSRPVNSAQKWLLVIPA